MIWWAWIVTGVVLFIFDIVTPWPVFIAFFGIGAAIVGVLTGLGAFSEAWVEWIAFGIISTILTVFLLPVFSKRTVKGYGGNSDDFIGEVATVRAPILAGELGQVELRGTHWQAKNIGSTNLEIGDRAYVKGRKGLTIEIEKS